MANLANGINLNGLMQKVQAAAAKSPAASSSSLFGSFSMTAIFIGLVAGLFGSVYFIYGKRKGNFTWLFSGIALWVVPLFIRGVLGLSLTCGALVLAPFLLGRYL